MSATAQTRPRRSAIATVLRVTSGNFLEMFDFFLFGFYATYISKAFFPAGSDFASLMLTFMTFGAGFLMRPLGAIILGAYIDQIGRRKGLILTLAMMAIGTMLIAFVPGYATIGLLAPALVLVGRLLQGFSAGVELGGVSVYLSEMATPGQQGLLRRLAVGQPAGGDHGRRDPRLPVEHAADRRREIGAWGWRIPFMIGCLIVPFLFYLRRSLQETEEFLARKHRPSTPEIFASIGQNWVIVLLGMMLVVMTTVSFYVITVYTPTFGKAVLKLTTTDSLVVTFCVGLSNFIWLPVMGALSDRVGRKPILLLFSGLTMLTAYPALAWLVAAPSFVNMLMVLLWLSFLYGSYNGAMVVALTEIVPVEVRTAGFSLAYALATALFGGFTPMVSTWLIEVTGNRAAPGLWMAFAGACGLVATIAVYSRSAVRTRAAREGQMA